MVKLEAALRSTGLKFTHHAWSKAPDGDYGTWSETSAGSLWADGKMAEQTMVVAVDFYTRDDTNRVRDIIQGALNNLDVSWYLDLIDFEDDGMIHYVWMLELPDSELLDGDRIG